MQLEPRIAPLGLEVRQIAALLAVCLALLEVWSTVSTAWTTGHLPQSYLDQPVDGAMPATCTQAAAQCPSNLITRLHGGERLLIQGSRTVLGPVGSIRVTIRFAWYPTRPAARTSFERPSIELCTVLKAPRLACVKPLEVFEISWTPVTSGSSFEAADEWTCGPAGCLGSDGTG